MFLKHLHFRNFRNYTELQIDLKSGLYFLVGENGQGKTNFLESIFVGATGRSALGSRMEDLIQEKETQAFLEAEFETKSQPLRVAMQLTRSGEKWIKLNGKNLGRTSDLLGKTSVVFLLPQQLNLITGGPQMRRDFWDEVLSVQSPRYWMALSDYQRLVKQKNVYLRDSKLHKKTVDRTFVEALNESMLGPATQIYVARQNLTAQLQKHMQWLYQEVFPAHHEVKLEYVSDAGTGLDLNSYRREFVALLARCLDAEIKKGAGVVGPAHDEMKISLAGKNARYFASHGQKRLLSLALKLAQGLVFEPQEPPIYLVDDVLLELDGAHREAVLGFLKRAPQVFLTTTSTHWLSPALISTGQILNVKSGHAVPA